MSKEMFLILFVFTITYNAKITKAVNPGAIVVKYLSALVTCEVKNTKYAKNHVNIRISKLKYLYFLLRGIWLYLPITLLESTPMK